MDTSETVSFIYENWVYDKGSILNELKNNGSLINGAGEISYQVSKNKVKF